jgi:N-acetylmuramoyl-L-alanine amidase
VDILEAPSPNHGLRREGAAINILLLHYTGMPDAASALARMRDPSAEVSAHYMVDEDGRVLRLVPEERRAWHAGRGYWAGERDINSVSIGIEIVNPGHEFGYRPFPEPQMVAVVALARDIAARHAIAPARVLGHSDIAPTRKEDPGELFDWRRLARVGLGIWPAPRPGDALDERAAIEALARIGYDPDAPLEAVLRAVQRRYRPRRLDGRLDRETASLIGALARLVDAGAGGA